MHRVELKDFLTCPDGALKYIVPNAPCGVESLVKFLPYKSECRVPNVPCGVERRAVCGQLSGSPVFLMYRVELKAEFFLSFIG